MLYQQQTLWRHKTTTNIVANVSIGIDIVSDMLTNQDMPPSQPIPFQRNGSSACIYFRNASPRFAYTLGKFHFYFAYVLGKIHSDFAYVLGEKLYLCNTNQ